MFRLIAPAGTPIGLSALASAMFSGNDEKSIVDAIKRDYDTKYCFLVSSGRAAQYLILRAWAEKDDLGRNEVIVPAYTCYSVAASIIRAGLRVRPVDIDPHTMDYDYNQLRQTDYSKVLAVIASNLFGIISDFEQLNSLKGEHGFGLIDDAAQSMGIGSKWGMAGSLGDAGFFSLDRGKNISAYSGGILITSDDALADSVRQALTNSAPVAIAVSFVTALKIMVYSLMLRPRLFWIPASMPFLRMGETIYDPDFAVGPLSGIQSRLAGKMYRRLSRINQMRAENGQRLAEGLLKSGKFRIPGADRSPAIPYPRLPVLAESKKARDESIICSRKAGIVATAMYPGPISAIKALGENLLRSDREFPGAEMVADCLFTLPTHPYLTVRDIEKVISILT